ncbi:ribonuclease III [Bifidobacterium avesanii]|uniref:Ribonuclease 3 n=1 Tax=Bifidobacterium avesanii TaxID=1798157 RepID=A0A7K3TFB8_9BIFI|nr:ribonuclease III [Bifidobacterium avesanii]KAB8294368.1 ribonuclease III [Bifidobacterium avesanii]NEG77797.1 ribonuclease III [Bifidobacterium avesanii]
MTKHNHSHAGDAPAAKPDDALLAALGTTISPELLVQALTHRSFAHEHEGVKHYERLEFLGDAVLELVATETLFNAHPDMTEGQLAKMRAKAVSEEALSAIAREKLHVGPYILLGHGEREDGGADKSSILCDIVESLIGATFVEHGIDEARKVVHRLVDDTLVEVATEGPALDWKTSLTVKAHGMGLEEPRYRMRVSGPEYALQFTAKVTVGEKDEIIGKGTGTSKRKAQLAAAEMAWHTLDAREKAAKQAAEKNAQQSAAEQATTGAKQDGSDAAKDGSGQGNSGKSAPEQAAE